MSLARILLLAAGAAAIAAPAAAQNGAMWVNPAGSIVTYGTSGDAPPPPSLDRAPAEMARLFKTLCLDTGGESAALRSAAGAAGLSTGEPGPNMLMKAPGIDLFVGDGLTLSRADRRGPGAVRQCNAAFHLKTLPTREAVVAAVSAALGGPPSNAAKGLEKDGKPKAFFIPEWRLDGGARIVAAFVSPDNKFMSGNRVHLSVRATGKMGK